jgi:hypothetical protein
MANTRGGVLVIGVVEDGGAASGLTPVPLSDEVTNRKQWLAQYVVPPRNGHRRVPSAADLLIGFTWWSSRGALMRRMRSGSARASATTTATEVAMAALRVRGR